jgi:hypothetical protein
MTSNTRLAAFGRYVIATVAALVLCSTWVQASDWVVSKASGQVWVASTRAQPVSLGAETVLQPGDTIRTGRNGRVLLARGEETILVAPNSVVALPDQVTSGLATTILQQAGSITIKAQKRDFNHFEVQTPYLAAVVKGTEFVVSIESSFASVGVMSGRVEVMDFKTGQVALVLAGQAARSSAPGENGLQLRGPGALSPVQQGQPGKATVQPMDVPKTGLGPPPNKPGLQVQALTVSAKLALALPDGVVRIAAPIGALKLDVREATGGLARSESARALSTATVWNSPAGPGLTVISSTSSANSSSATTSGGGGTTNLAASGNVGGNGGIGVGVNVGNNLAIGIGLGNGNGSGLGVGIENGTVGLNVGNVVGIAIGKKK